MPFRKVLHMLWIKYNTDSFKKYLTGVSIQCQQNLPMVYQGVKLGAWTDYVTGCQKLAMFSWFSETSVDPHLNSGTIFVPTNIKKIIFSLAHGYKVLQSCSALIYIGMGQVK